MALIIDNNLFIILDNFTQSVIILPQMPDLLTGE